MLLCGGREAMAMTPPPTRDSAVSPCFHGCLAFLHRHFPPQSPPSHPLDLSLHSQQQPSPRDCFTIPKLQLPATASSGVCMAVARTVWFSFHLGCHRSAVSLSVLNVSPLIQTVALLWWLGPCFRSLVLFSFILILFIHWGGYKFLRPCPWIYKFSFLFFYNSSSSPFWINTFPNGKIQSYSIPS